jgi:hypothetical protein
VQIVEQFHLLFLAQLGRRLDKTLYVVKGGCNLRFFHRSVRLSEDVDSDVAGFSGGRLATPEKALVDFLYLAPARSRLFRALPELELPVRFSPRRARAIVARIGSARRRTMVSRALDTIILGARRRRKGH